MTEISEKILDDMVWADALAEGTAPALREPEMLADVSRKYSERQELIGSNYDATMRGEMDYGAASKERLRLAHEGDPLTGERVPLTFSDPDVYREFQEELRAILEAEGIRDAVIQQVGSATTGWKGNPTKKIGEWGPPKSQKPSDTDLAIFSPQALSQAREAGVPVNTNIHQGGRHTIFRSGDAPEDGGFYATSLGEQLFAFGQRWNERIYGSVDVDGFDFKLNLTAKPFSGAITVVGRQ